VTVSNAATGGGTSVAVNFAVSAPTPKISGITPSTLAQASTGTLLISGSGFEANSSVQWNGSARATTFVNAQTLQAFVGSDDTASVGNAQVTVNNPGPGGSTTAATSEAIYALPTISSLSPATIQSGSPTTQITVTGTNFIAGSQVLLDSSVLNTTYVSATSLQATVSAPLLLDSRTAKVSVHNPDPAAGDSPTASLQITSPTPTLAGITPTFVTTGAAANIGLLGKGFASNSTVLWNGSPRTVTYYNSGSLLVALTASDLATAGSGQLTVSNPVPGGGVSAAQTLTIVSPPVISSVSPATIQQTNFNGSTPTPVTINGSNFAANATAYVNGFQITITSQSSTQIVGTIPLSVTSYSGGVVNLYVYTPLPSGGLIASQSAKINIINPSATFTVNPTGAPVGSPDTTITIYGSSFFPDSVVQWNGVALPTTYSSTNSLTATIPASYLSLPGSGQIHINTPENLGQASPSVAFAAYLSLPVNDLVWSPSEGLIYATIPSSAGSPYGNSLAAIDPTTGAAKKYVFVGSEPDRLALSTDGTQAFVGLDGAGSVRQVSLATMTADVQFSLGGGQGVYNPPYTASSLAAVPGQPNSVAVYCSSSVISIYDAGVPRAKSSGTASIFSSGA
jgi:hypothetical protein